MTHIVITALKMLHSVWITLIFMCNLNHLYLYIGWCRSLRMVEKSSWVVPQSQAWIRGHEGMATSQCSQGTVTISQGTVIINRALYNLYHWKKICKLCHFKIRIYVYKKHWKILEKQEIELNQTHLLNIIFFFFINISLQVPLHWVGTLFWGKLLSQFI